MTRNFEVKPWPILLGSIPLNEWRRGQLYSGDKFSRYFFVIRVVVLFDISVVRSKIRCPNKFNWFLPNVKVKFKLLNFSTSDCWIQSRIPRNFPRECLRFLAPQKLAKAFTILDFPSNIHAYIFLIWLCFFWTNVLNKMRDETE